MTDLQGGFQVSFGNRAFGKDLFVATLVTTTVPQDLAEKIRPNLKSVIDLFINMGTMSYYMSENGTDDVRVAFSWGPFGTEEEADEAAQQGYRAFVAFDNMLEGLNNA